MKIGKLLFVFLLGLGLMTITSCGGDDDDDDGGNDNNDGFSCANVEEYFGASLQTLTEAAQNFTNNPSATTCNAYVDAFEDYVDDLELVLTCPGITNEEELEQALVEARQAVDETRAECSSF